MWLLLLERDRWEHHSTGIISKKHAAELQQWLERLGIGRDASTPEMMYDLDLSGRTFNIPDLKYLGYMPHLLFLNLSETNLNDDGTHHVKPLAYLKYLYVNKTSISKLSFAETMETIEVLYESWTKIDDEELRHIGNMTRLKELALANTEITDSGQHTWHA